MLDRQITLAPRSREAKGFLTGVLLVELGAHGFMNASGSIETPKDREVLESGLPRASFKGSLGRNSPTSPGGRYDREELPVEGNLYGIEANSVDRLRQIIEMENPLAVPDFQSLTLPVLYEFADGLEHATKDVRSAVAVKLGLSDQDFTEKLPSGTQSRFANRIAWAHVYMKRAQLLSSPRRGIYRITERGQSVLKSPPAKIDIEFLNQYPEIAGFRSTAEVHNLRGHDPALTKDFSEGSTATPESRILTPDEQVQFGAARIKEHLVTQILDRVMKGSPAAFERLVVDVLVAMGYGGSHADAAEVVGKGGDGGIDGVIKEDRLGLDSIYVQAKRWEGSVGRPVIQQFVGALHERKARKGVIITASTFTREAIQSAKDQIVSVKLIDGKDLAAYMIEFGVGVSPMETIKTMKLDEDYFTEE